jgi:signal transduction histidine kinase
MLYFSLLIAIILLGTSYLLYQNAYTNQISHIDGSLYVIMNSLVQEIEEENEDIYVEIEETQQIFKMALLHVRITHYNLITKKQSLVAQSSSSKQFSFDKFDFEKNSIIDKVIFKTSNGYRVAMELLKRGNNTLQLLQIAVVISFKKEIIQTLIFVDIIIFLFFILGSYLLISKTLLPVYKVVESVNAIEAYDYTKRVSVKNIPNEIKELVETFNRLLTRHQKSFSKISQFSSDASHELKTPLTSIRGEIEVGLRRERDSKEYRTIMQKSLSKIIDIQKLIDGLLFLAKSDKLKIQSSFEEVYMDEIIAECRDELQQMAYEKSIDITIDLIPLTIKGDSKLLKIACINILKNAILYSPRETKIDISMDESNSMVIFQDQGIGIPKDDIEYIFDRFYRVDKTKSKVNGGTGLGLSIVKMILDIHGFDILIESKINKGTIVKILVGGN